MNSAISSTGWIIIIVLAVFIVAINISLLFALKDKNKQDNWISRISSTAKKARDPFRDENKRMQELSEKVDQFRNKNKLSGD